MKYLNRLRSLTIMICLLCFSQIALSEVVVIVNPGNASALTEKDIKRIFLGKMKSFPSGGTILPVNHSASSDIRKSFDKSALGKSASQIKAYWSKLVFSGKGNPPKELPNDAEIVKLVSENPAVIGYIDSANKSDGVKVVGSY
ncbi:MAG: phosphate ABC transporter substrate-binding protein [Kangiellaceae bacterium]|nr:phosphate ABC transporter substrate-binding protein [Kangiellaceae bacterium]